ncbi:MAG: Fic family protein [Christensenellaceae bacterium]|jgi:cell filamentation protein|nr:Fic family protein [Christensenellaceae bacterium]
MNATKTSIRFFDDCEVRAVWDDEKSKWYFSVLDVVGAINGESNYEKTRNYWKYLKAKIRKVDGELVSATTQLKFVATDGKKYGSDALDADGIILLAQFIPNNKAARFLDWFLYSENTVDGQSKKKAYAFWERNLLGDTEVGSVKALQKIHAYIFGGLYDFAGKIRSLTISKGGFTFAPAQFLPLALSHIELMPETTFDEIVDKYVEMNVAHPFMDGNGRSTRLWLDLMFKSSLKKCVDWSKIDKKDYLDAMQKSVVESSAIKALLQSALTDKINDREVFMKGVDYSYYYEEDN